MADPGDIVRERTDSRLSGAGFEDPRPALRGFLKRLRVQDPDSFAEATNRYEQVLVPAVSSESADPLVAWSEYARWLVNRLAPGKALNIDRTGLATPAEPEPRSDMLMIHLPDDHSTRAIVLLAPLELTEAQRETVKLLAG